MVKLEGLHVVTGAFGYTGRWIAHHLLKQEAQVRTLTNSIGRDSPLFLNYLNFAKLSLNFAKFSLATTLRSTIGSG